MDDDNDQDILDQHVSRVWSDMTPNQRSPGTLSPCIQHLARRKPHDLGFLPTSEIIGNAHVQD